MQDVEIKQKTRFKKLRDTLDIVEQQEKIKLEKVSICDRMCEIYRNRELDLSKKSEMVLQVLSAVMDGR